MSESLKEIKEFRIVDKKFLEVTYVDNCNLIRIDLEAFFCAKVVEEKNEQKYSSEGLEALNRIENQFSQLGIKYKESGCHIREDDYFTIEKALKRLEEIEKAMFLNNKQLKASEIIKNKGIDWRRFKLCETVEEYNDPIIRYGLFDLKPYTEEEYKLLKEVIL